MRFRATCLWVLALLSPTVAVNDTNTPDTPVSSSSEAPRRGFKIHSYSNKKLTFDMANPFAIMRTEAFGFLVEPETLNCSTRLDEQPPLYLSALQGTFKLFLSEHLFPTTGWTGALKPSSFVLAMGMNGIALWTAISDLMHGWRYLFFAWGFALVAIPSCVAGIGVCFWGCYCKEGQIRKQWMAFGAVLVIAFPLVGFAAISRQDYTSPEIQEVNCESLRWTSSSQIPSVVQSIAIVVQFCCANDPHWTRLATLIPWVVLNVIYIPILITTFVTHVFPGLLEFLPITIVVFCLLGVYGAIVYWFFKKEEINNPNAQALLEETQNRSTWGNWAGRTVKYCVNHQGYEREDDAYHELLTENFVRWQSYLPKASAVPVMLVWKFFGEVIVKFRAGFSWWTAVWTTWSERTLVHYVSQLLSSLAPRLQMLQTMF